MKNATSNSALIAERPAPACDGGRLAAENTGHTHTDAADHGLSLVGSFHDRRRIARRFIFSARITVCTVLVALATLPAAAREYNERPHLDPATSAKVNRVIAESWRTSGHGAESHVNVRSGNRCGSQVIGDFSDQDAPREMIIVAKDIININNNCRR